MPDQLVRATAFHGFIRGVGVVTTDAISEARRRHHLSHVATATLGRTMSAALLMASTLKEPQARITVQIRGDGPLGQVCADAGADGTVRGYVDHAGVELPLTPAGKLDVGTAVGRYGYMHVTRDFGYGTPYSSTVELATGEIASDVTQYLATSEQTPSVVLLGERLDLNGVRVSGGILLQLMPGYPDHLLAQMEATVPDIPPFTSLVAEGKSLETMLTELLAGFEPHLLPRTQSIRFHCPCSPKRVLGALRILGEAELRDMIQTDRGAEATCHFCHQVYTISEQELEQLVAEMQAQPSS